MTAKAQQTTWRPAAEDNQPIVEDEGDIFAPLKRVRQQYYDAANKLATKISNDEYEGDLSVLRAYVGSLRDCGDRVGKLIPIGAEIQEAQDAELITGNEPAVRGVLDAGSSIPSGDPISQDLGQCQDSTQESLQSS